MYTTVERTAGTGKQKAKGWPTLCDTEDCSADGVEKEERGPTWAFEGSRAGLLLSTIQSSLHPNPQINKTQCVYVSYCNPKA